MKLKTSLAGQTCDSCTILYQIWFERCQPDWHWPETSLYCLFLIQILNKAYFLPHIGTGAETKTQYDQLSTALDEYVRKTFNEWTTTVDKDCMKLLEVPLLARSVEKTAMLDVNFDK